MNLLTNPKGRMIVVRALLKHENKISVICCMLGITIMVLLAHEEFSAKNYFSENQLLPGLADSYFSEYRYGSRIYKSLSSVCKDQSAVSALLEEELNDFGLDVYQQTFYVKSPQLNGTNTYGIYRSPRASGVESIVISVPLHEKCSSNGAVALLLSIAKYFSKQSFWAKDIIFLLTEHKVYGMKAWLSSYYNDISEGIVVEELQGHGGSIKAAIVFDFDKDYISHFDLLIEGLNGQLPNLDVINLIYRISRYENVPVKFQHQDVLDQPNSDFIANFQTVFRMMVQQASGYPSGNHGMFLKYRIESVTLLGKIDKKINRQKIHLEQLGRFTEGIFRSINNMLESFHQSFFLYVLPNTQRYISIGLYMPPIGCFVASLVVKLLVLWIKIFNLDNQDQYEGKICSTYPSIMFPFSVWQSSIISNLSSWCVLYSLKFLLIHQEHIVFHEKWDILIFSLVTLLIAVSFLRLFIPSNESERSVLKFHIIVCTALLIVVTAIINFSMGFFFAIFSIPLVILNVSKKNLRLPCKLVVFIISFVCNPFMGIYIITLVSKTSFNQTLAINTSKLHENYLISVENIRHFISNEYLGIMTTAIIQYGIFPLWLLLVAL